LDSEEGTILLDTEFEFSHLSGDKTTAVFKASDEINTEFVDFIRDAITDYIAGDNFQSPQHTITIGHDLTGKHHYSPFPYSLAK